MKNRIYQANETSEYRFMALKGEPDESGIIGIPLDEYEEVWSGETDSKSLEDIFEEFNIRKPEGFHGHSLSVSDIVKIGNSYWYCDSIGWKEVRLESKKIRAIVVMPGQEPEIKTIDTSLESLQSEVGGWIEFVYPFKDEVGLLCNEEGKLIGLEWNRPLIDELGRIYDIIAGTFLVVGLGDEGDLRSLTDEETQKYLNYYSMEV